MATGASNDWQSQHLHRKFRDCHQRKTDNCRPTRDLDAVGFERKLSQGENQLQTSYQVTLEILSVMEPLGSDVAARWAEASQLVAASAERIAARVEIQHAATQDLVLTANGGMTKRLAATGCRHLPLRLSNPCLPVISSLQGRQFR